MSQLTKAVKYTRAASAISFQLAGDGAVRRGATVANASTTILYIGLGFNPSPSNYTVALNPGDYYETPFGYTGPLFAIGQASVTGNVHVTEVY